MDKATAAKVFNDYDRVIQTRIVKQTPDAIWLQVEIQTGFNTIVIATRKFAKKSFKDITDFRRQNHDNR